MKIGIDASDLCNPKIDGTKVYVQNLVRQIRNFDQKNQYVLYYPDKPTEEFVHAPNFEHKILSWPIFWTQTKFAKTLFSDKPNVLWMPFHPLAKT